MKFGTIVLQANAHPLTESDFRFNIRFQNGGHDIISGRKVLPPDEWIWSICLDPLCSSIRQLL